jgi:XTP/dITP diphosphohydrolase
VSATKKFGRGCEVAMRKWQGGALVVATHNAGKVVEINQLLAPFDVDAVSAGSLGLEEPEETEASFIGNALLKARAAAVASKTPALADDSGLAVDALNGAPGIFSARWAGPAKDFGMAMRRVKRELAVLDKPSHRAAFVCALALVWPDGHEVVFEGQVEGTLTFPPRGLRGFGYDPIFVPSGFQETFGEMDPSIKHAMSHRARAFEQLVAACFQ